MKGSFKKTRNKKYEIIYFAIIISAFVSSAPGVFCADNIENAKKIAGQGDYKSAYDKLLIITEEMQSEIKNLRGLLQYYKDELTKTNSPQQAVDYTYNEAANTLWASAWSIQHDGVFKKTGKEKEECLQRAVDTYKRITIDYPSSAKAEEAQYQIARVYYKFIKNDKRAEDEFQRYLDIYPNGRFAGESKEILMRLRRE